MMFPNLFRPGRIGQLQLRNRVLKAPTSTGMSNMDGSVSERLIRHYRDVARGGAGLIICEYAFIDDQGAKSAHCQLGISSDDHIPGLAWLAQTIKEEGACAGIQIEHCGRQKFLGTQPIVAPSVIPWPALKAKKGQAAVPRELTDPEIWQIIDAFGDATRRAVDAGFELVEIHGAHGYLITNFLSPHTNKRTDQWGGSLENRTRFLVEVVKNARAKVGRGFPLTVRLSGTDYEPDGFPVTETVEVAKSLEALGIDAIHVSGGDHHQMIHQVSPMAVERCHNVWAAAEIKKHVNIPIIASGSITLPHLAEAVLAEGKGDFIGLARPLWADPDWVNKARDGRAEDIRPCIRCNDGCLDRTFFRYQAVSCSVNPVIGREGDLKISPASHRRNVCIIGGGPAGLEAARICAERGHAVTLYEKRALGGVSIEGSVAEFKSDLRPLIEYWKTQLDKLGVTVRFQEAGVEAARGADVVVVAIGGMPSAPNIPGMEGKNVTEALAVFNGTATVGHKVVVLGGGETAVEVALYLDDQGHDVTILHRREALMTRDVAVTDRIAYSEMIATRGLPVFTNLQVVAIDEHGVSAVDSNGGNTRVEADTVVTALGYRPLASSLAGSLRAAGVPEVHEIGDGVHPAKILDAVHAGYKLGMRI
jgi:2,4-dienoyl-CoA reductase-like NADH-dependent reductase (Old Yellow Enzyme family)/thioredoxin reductase